MNEMDTLANQHFLEWESRMRHIDEMLAKANKAHANNAGRADIATELKSIQKSRDALALEIDSVRNRPLSEQSTTGDHANGVKTALSAIGLQMERLLSSVVGAD